MEDNCSHGRYLENPAARHCGACGYRLLRSSADIAVSGSGFGGGSVISSQSDDTSEELDRLKGKNSGKRSISDPVWISMGAVVWGLFLCGTACLKSVQARIVEKEINRAFVKLVDTDRDGIISPSEKRVVTDYLVDHLDSKDLTIDYYLEKDLRENSVNADLPIAVRRDYLSVNGISGTFWHSCGF